MRWLAGARPDLSAQRAGGDVDHLARAHELHARAALGLAEAGLVDVDRAPALPGHELRALRGEELLARLRVGVLGRVELARVAVVDRADHEAAGDDLLLAGRDGAAVLDLVLDDPDPGHRAVLALAEDLD